MAATILSLMQITKSFDHVPVLRGVSMDIAQGEFITLLGPSGCGKTTLLRAIAGLEQADGGQIILNGQDVTALPPHARNVNTVFQNYALFPHMNVYDNIAYGPRIQKQDKARIKKQVADMLALVQMTGYEKRMPDQLSGGQRQRIAIARALINNPHIVLLDEPLGALDLKLRQHMQSELKNIQKQTGVTFIYVTHDQEEALNMSDRIVVMKDGQFEQIGTPEDVYQRPETLFVAEFVGNRNILPVKITKAQSGRCLLDFQGQPLESAPYESQQIVQEQSILLAIHEDRLHISDESGGVNCLAGTVTETGYTGAQVKTVIQLDSGQLIRVVSYESSRICRPRDRVFATFKPEDGVLIPVHGGKGAAG